MKTLIAIALLSLLGATSANACDCLISKNWSNPACKGKTPVPAKTTPSTAALSNGQSQSQGQALTSTIGVGSTSSSAVTGSGNNTGSNLGGKGGSVGNTTSSSVATGGAGGVAAGGMGGSGGSGGQGGAAQGGASQSDSSSGGNSYSSFSAASRIPASTALAGVGITTAGCRFAEGLGVQTMPAGTSVGLSFKDHDCARFEIAQYLYSRGQNTAGDKIMCQIKDVKEALGADCLTTVGLIASTAPAPQTDAVTHDELQQAERRIVTRMVSK